MRFRPHCVNNGLTGYENGMSEEIHVPSGKPERVLSIASAKVLKRDTYEATREAQDIVGQAHQKARQIVEDAEQERARICQRAEQEGRIRGLAEWNKKLLAASQQLNQLTKTWEQSMLRLSVRAAEKLIGEELKLRPETIADIVREVLKGARSGKLLTIHVNAADAPQVRAHLDRIKTQAGVRGEVDIATSAQVPPGGCILESELGVIDARLETQLQCLEEALVADVSRD